MSGATELTQLVRAESSTRIRPMPSLYSICIEKIKQSRCWEQCILTVPVSTIKLDLLTSDMYKNPIIGIATHYQGSDGEVAIGSNCGYHVLREVFLIGSFETCVFFEPRDHTRWFYSLSIEQVVDGDFERIVADLLSVANGCVDEKRARLSLESINEWLDKHKVCLQKLCG